MHVNSSEKGYKQLRVYQEAHKFVLLVYRLSEAFPRSEVFGLTSQMRRAAVSVVANIVEGHARAGKQERKQFLYIANGSLVEVEYYLELTLALQYISEAQHKEADVQRRLVGALLGGFINHLKKQTA